VFNHRRIGQAGTTMIEVLVSILILSVGMLSLSGLMAFAVQIPKVSGYRSAAINIGSAHIEKIRANLQGLYDDAYSTQLSYNGAYSELSPRPCAYPTCNATTLADMDDAETKRIARLQLPAGGVLFRCDPAPCSPASFGNLWILWRDPDTISFIDPGTSDNCPDLPAEISGPKPRCVYLRFKP
jgi:type IV pilus assembly protein PilV